jgi:thiamine pyrophosphate-dependent acetolactate synthase large subunit-like protein
VTGAEAFVRMLQLHSVKHVFGLCGDTSLPLYDALYRLDHGIRHVLTRDERSASYMADGYARVSGRVGVCEGPSGGGATDHAAVASAFGVKSWRVDDPAKLRDALAAATAVGAPALVDVICQPLQDALAPVTEWIA